MSKIYLSPSNQYANIGKGEYGTEKNRMCELAELVKAKLTKNFEVKMADYNSDLSTRAIESDNWGSDIYVALHTNAGGGRGCEIYAYSTRSKGYILAQKIYNYIENATPSTDRGIKFNDLYETGAPNAPAILVEFFFHDNIDDVNWYLSNKDTLATAITKGIYEYFGIPYEEVKSVEPTPSTNNEIKELKVKITTLENKKTELISENNILSDKIKSLEQEQPKLIYTCKKTGTYKIKLNNSEKLYIKN